ncbi:MAG TPA: Maf family protein [Jatrophihabitantaceae bacterium]
MTARRQVDFVLASASPARYALLRSAGLSPEVIVSAVDEHAVAALLDPGAPTAVVVAELAVAKARDVAAGLGDVAALVLGCDSLLDLDGVALGKPGDAETAAARWRDMRGRTGTLHTGHCLIDIGTGRELARTAATTVHFADISDAEIELYAATGEPAAVAGAFTVDGLGGWFVDAVHGDHHNVIGLSLPLLRRMLAELGYGLSDVGYPAGYPEPASSSSASSSASAADAAAGSATRAHGSTVV